MRRAVFVAPLAFAVVACGGRASELGPAEEPAMAPTPARFGDTVFPVIGQGQREPRAPAVSVAVFLLDDGAALSFYEEGILGHGFNPTSDLDGPGHVDSRRRVTSTWRVDAAGALEVGELLRCEHRRWPAPPHPSSDERLFCELLRDVVTPGARGAELIMRALGGEIPADGSHPYYDAFVEDSP